MASEWSLHGTAGTSGLSGRFVPASISRRPFPELNLTCRWEFFDNLALPKAVALHLLPFILRFFFSRHTEIWLKFPCNRGLWVMLVAFGSCKPLRNDFSSLLYSLPAFLPFSIWRAGLPLRSSFIESSNKETSLPFTPWGFCVCCGLRKGVPEGRAVQPVWCEEQEEAAPCVCSWIWLSDGWEVCWALLMAPLCFPSRVRLMTALIMPDGSHQSPFNSRKMPKYCLQNWFVHSFSSFQPGSDPQAALRDLLRRSRVENCQNRLLYGFSED